MRHRAPLAPLFLAACLALGCNDRNTPSAAPAPSQQQAAPQSNPDASGATSNSAAAPADPNASPAIAWTLPPGWTVNPEQRPMRYATLLTPEKAEVAVSVFPGAVGGTLANINRWRAQVGADPITEAELDKNVQHLSVNGADVLWTDIQGKDARMLAAIFPDRNQLWFFKLSGPSEQLTRQKDNFLNLLKSVKLNPAQ